MDAPSEDELKKRLGSCYVCEAWYWTGKKLRCEKGNNIGEMKKQGSPCLEKITGVLNIYNTKDEFDNVETKYS